MSRAMLVAIASVLIAGTSLRVSAQGAPGNVPAGRQLALRSCAVCHIVARDQDVSPMAYNAPTFFDIANRPNIDSASLRAFLTQQPPMHRMTNPRLTPAEISDVSAYLLSLRGSR